MAGTDGDADGKPLVAIALVVIGVITILVGILGAVNDWGAEETKQPVAAKDTPNTVAVGPARTETSSGDTTAATSDATTPTTTASPTTAATSETPQQFLTMLADNIGLGGTPFLTERLHPEVITRYGLEQCENSTLSQPDPEVKFDVISVSEPATYAWATDGLSTDIPDTLTVEITRTATGTSGPATVHITAVDGTYRWFTDCGEPSQVPAG